MMKTIIKNILFGILVSTLSIPVVFGQTYINEPNNTNGNSSTIQGEEVSPEILANLGILKATNPKNAIIRGNSVFVTQIGEFNTSSISTSANASEINLLQKGNNNDAKLKYNANTVVADLIQNGNNNRIIDFVNSQNADVSLDLTQEGSFLNFEREGINELTKSLKFKQTEGTPSLIIRSFN